MENGNQKPTLVFFCCDIEEKFLKHLKDPNTLVQNAIALNKYAKENGHPIIITE